MPPRLYVMMSEGSLKWFTTIALSDGVGLKSEQLMTSTPTSRGCRPASSSAFCTLLNSASSASSRASRMFAL